MREPALLGRETALQVTWEEKPSAQYSPAFAADAALLKRAVIYMQVAYPEQRLEHCRQ